MLISTGARWGTVIRQRQQMRAFVSADLTHAAGTLFGAEPLGGGALTLGKGLGC